MFYDIKTVYQEPSFARNFQTVMTEMLFVVNVSAI